MPQNWIFNTSIITDPGTYQIEKINLSHASKWIRSKKWDSAIGHQGTALILSEMLEMEVPTNRVQAHMEPGSEALVFKLMNRLPEGTILSSEELKSLEFEFWIIKRIA